MRRRPEAELMLDEGSAQAYAEADFSEQHDRFTRLFREMFAGPELRGHVLDLGCGAADVTLRFALAHPGCVVHGVDGSAAMLRHGRARLARTADLRGRVELFEGILPEARLPRRRYDAVISNSLLHHLHRPEVLWQSVRRYGAAGAPVLVMDLRRPETAARARLLRDRYEAAAGQPEVLGRDFHRSLRAAFTAAEVAAQLSLAGLGHFVVQDLGDLHLVAGGRCAATAPNGSTAPRPKAQKGGTA